MDIASLTSCGGREENEDFFSVCEKSGEVCITVCDGLGGHAAGQVASKAACDAFTSTFSSHSGAADDFFAAAFDNAAAALCSAAKENPALAGMKTTAVSLVLSGGNFRFANIGDSRLYGFKKGKAELLSFDHSYTRMLAEAGEIKLSQIRRHPDRNILLRALGTSGEKPEYDSHPSESAKDYSAFLLCTDGFWELINERKMARELLHSDSAEKWLKKMEKSICRKGRRKNMDNYTAVAVIITERDVD